MPHQDHPVQPRQLRQLTAGRAWLRLVLNQLSPKRASEVDYLLGGFYCEPGNEDHPELCLVADESQAALAFDGRELIKAQEPRALLPWLEWQVNDFFLNAETGLLQFHASAVAVNDTAVLLTARSNSGKSTLTLELVARRGFGFLSDDVASWDPVARQVVPYLRPIRLKATGFSLFPDFSRLGLRFSVPYFSAPLWYISPQREFPAPAPRPCNRVILIDCSFRPGVKATLKPRSRGEALQRLLTGCWTFSSFNEPDVFLHACDLAELCSCYRLRFGDFRQAAGVLESFLS